MLRGCLCAAAICFTGAESRALDVTAARAETIRYGAPHGAAVSKHGDRQRLRRVGELPPASASVLWQKLVVGGVSGNLLVDAGERLFVASNGHVAQFANDGTQQFDVRANVSEALELALLSDDARCVLGREGHLLAYDPNGELRFDVELDGSSTWSEGHVIGIDSGGAAAALGTWLYHVDARGALQGRARWSAKLNQLLALGAGIVALDEKGRVLEWDGRGEPKLRGSFGARTVASLLPGRELLAVAGGQTLVRLALDSGTLESRLTETAGLLTTLAVPSVHQILLFRGDGARLLLGAGDAVNVATTRLGAARIDALDVVSAPDGSRAWWAANLALAIETPSGEALHELAAVRCPDPVSLTSLGRGRLAAACGGGQLWAIGPASSPPEVRPPS